MGKYNWKQISLVGVMLFMIGYAWSKYGIAGGLLFVAISMVMLRLFFKALSTENRNAQIREVCPEDSDSFGEFDPIYDPSLSAYPQNIYHKD